MDDFRFFERKALDVDYRNYYVIISPRDRADLILERGQHPGSPSLVFLTSGKLEI